MISAARQYEVRQGPDAARDVDESLLLQRVRAGDKAAFGALVDRYIARASALAFRVVQDRTDSQDVVQDAFLTALHRIESFDVTRPFWPWFSRIVVNRGIDVAERRAKRATVPLDATLAGSARTHAAVESREIREHMQRALEELPPRRRLIAGMFEVDGFSIAEIAQHLGMTQTTVRWHVHVARKTLRACLSVLRTNS